MDIPKIFENTDQINEYLLKDTTPLEYCKSVIADTISQIMEYLNGNKENHGFDSVHFFWNRQCDIYLKNHIVFQWTLETPLAALIIPNLDDIEYVVFYDIPKRMTPEDAKQLGISKEVYETGDFYGFCSLGRYIDNLGHFEYRFDSIHGAYREDDEYGKNSTEEPFSQREIPTGRTLVA